jgi:hypothetical protein
MRIGIVRSDIGNLYLSDVENSSQRNFSSEPRGQSRYFSKPTDAQLQAAMNASANLTIRGSDTAATVDTTVANGTRLNIKTSAAAAFTQVTVTSNATLAKAQIVTELNAQFALNGLGLVARISGTNQVTIDSTAKGAAAYIATSASSPSTGALHTVLGIAAAATTPISVATLKAAVYPTSTTVNVAAATINALGTFALMTPAQQTANVASIADVVAPTLVETGPALLSFVHGQISKLRSATFRPGGARSGIPAGIAAAVVASDGSTVFSL